MIRISQESKYYPLWMLVLYYILMLLFPISTGMGMQNHHIPSNHQMFVEQDQMKSMNMNGYNQGYPQQQQLPPSQQSIPKKTERKKTKNNPNYLLFCFGLKFKKLG